MQNEPTTMHDTDEPTIRFTVEVAVPAEHARAYLDAMTGNDDDVLLAAEIAMRDRLGCHGGREIELAYDDPDDEIFERFVAEAATNERRERAYGPAA